MAHERLDERAADPVLLSAERQVALGAVVPQSEMAASGSPVREGVTVTPSAIEDRARWLGSHGRQLETLLLIIVVVGCVLLATAFRQTWVPKWRTIWAEDGTVFAQCAYDLAAIDCLLEPYAGYSHLVPRLAAELATLGGPEGLPSRLMLLAGLVAAFAAAVAAVAILRVTGSAVAGLLSGVSLALVNPAGIEVLGNLANLHWILLATATVVVACMWLGVPPGGAGLILLALATLSSPFAPLLLLPMALVALLRRDPASRMTTLVVGVAAAVQLLVMITSERPAAAGSPPSVAELVAWTGVALRDWGWFGWDHPAANIAAVVGAVAVVLALAIRRRVWAALVLTWLMLVGLAIHVGSAYLIHATTFRYAYVLVALTVATVAIGLGLLVPQIRRPIGSVILITTVAVIGLGFATTFRVVTGSSGGPDVLAQIDTSDCSEGTRVRIDISPPPWEMWVPCPGD